MIKYKLLLSVLTVMSLMQPTAAQTIDEVISSQASYVTSLTSWGVRPEWDETSENIYFLHRLIGDVFKINIRTREITAITTGIHHSGIQRCMCLSNGDLLICMGDTNTGDMERDKAKLAMFVLKKSEPSKLYPLNAFCCEGPAVSKTGMKIAWTLPGQLEIKMADLLYERGVPKLNNTKTIISYIHSSETLRLETQDFRPPYDKELLYTHYTGPNGVPYLSAEVYGYELATGKTTDYTKAKDSYDEAEGVFPDGQWMMFESDRHQPEKWKKRWKVDAFRLKLDGSGEVEQMANLAERFPDTLRSDNPVVSKDGRYVAYQFGFSQGEGARGQGIFLLDLQERTKALGTIKK